MSLEMTTTYQQKGTIFVCFLSTFSILLLLGFYVTLQSFSLFQMIWVCILCRKKQELLIKTGTWMHSTAEMSSDPILRRMEQDMAATPTSSIPTSSKMGGGAGGSNVSTPQNVPLSPAASSISSLFSKAMSLTGTPTNPFPPTRPHPPPQFSHPVGVSNVVRQRSLDSSDSGMSPSYPMRPQSRMARHMPMDDEPQSGGEATPTVAFPTPTYHQPPPPAPSQPTTTRFRPPIRGSRPYLTRGHSLGDSGPLSPGVSSSISFQARPTPIRSTVIDSSIPVNVPSPGKYFFDYFPST